MKPFFRQLIPIIKIGDMLLFYKKRLLREEKKMSNYDYELIVIGGGAAGLSSAFTAQNLGKDVALVEEDKLGGECTWSGCVPSKALIKASKVAQQSRGAEKYGIQTQVEVESKKVLAYVDSVVADVYEKEKPEVLAEEGITVLQGRAQFIDKNTLKVGKAEVSAAKIIIATGSKPYVPPIKGLEEVDYLTNESFFALDELPQSMVILGGGAIGVELAQALNRLGVEITVVEIQDSILAREESDLVQILRDKLDEEGVNLLTGYRAEKVVKKDGRVVVTALNKDEETRKVEGAELLVAVGRKPNLASLNLAKIGIETDQQGIAVDNKLRTSVSNIYACGDIVGPYRFSHVSNYEGVTATLNALLPLPIKRKVDYSNLLWVTYTDPELAHLGLTESQARKEYNKIRVYEFDYEDLDRAETDANGAGKAKFICDSQGTILGAHILGARAGELIHEGQILKSLDESITELSAIIHAYPTYSELNKKVGTAAKVEELKSKYAWLSKLIK